MSSEDTALAPLQAARKKLEDAIEVHLGKVAALRKRSDALQSAINVLRSSDEDLIEFMPARATKARVTDFNVAAVESAVLEALANPHSFPQLETYLRENGHEYSKAGLRRILKTSPQIKVRGQRDATRYFV